MITRTAFPRVLVTCFRRTLQRVQEVSTARFQSSCDEFRECCSRHINATRFLPAIVNVFGIPATKFRERSRGRSTPDFRCVSDWFSGSLQRPSSGLLSSCGLGLSEGGEGRLSTRSSGIRIPGGFHSGLQTALKGKYGNKNAGCPGQGGARARMWFAACTKIDPGTAGENQSERRRVPFFSPQSASEEDWGPRYFHRQVFRRGR